jgi:hypothetical protein
MDISTLLRMRVTYAESSTSTPMKICLVEVALSTVEHRDYFKRISTVEHMEINFINVKYSQR